MSELQHEPEPSAASSRILQAIDGDLPARTSAAFDVLLLTDNPDVGVAEIATVVARDPGLTARAMRVANSAFYGLPGRVGSAQFAISVIGFSTLRAMAAAAAAGIDDPSKLPDGYLEDAAHVAVACSTLGPRVGVSAHEAQGLGLLHNLGTWLLHMFDPAGYLRLRQDAASSDIVPHELEL